MHGKIRRTNAGRRFRGAILLALTGGVSLYAALTPTITTAAGRRPLTRLEKEQRSDYRAKVRAVQKNFVRAQLEIVKQQQEAQKKLEREVLNRYDWNENGIIDGQEKAPAQRFLRKLQQGKDPDAMPVSRSKPKKEKAAKSKAAKSSPAKAADEPANEQPSP